MFLKKKSQLVIHDCVSVLVCWWSVFLRVSLMATHSDADYRYRRALIQRVVKKQYEYDMLIHVYSNYAPINRYKWENLHIIS